jgi:tetratricopeptide (TPR) repeat protein
MQNAVPVAVQKAPAKNSEFPDLETAAVHALAAKDALALYDHYSATHTMTPSQEQSFNERHKTWEGRARQGLVRLGNKWVVSAEAERAHEEAARLYRQAQGMTKTLYFAEARLALKQASRVDPDSIAADFSLGILDSIAPVELRSPKDAMTHFRSVLQRTPGYVPALNNLAIAEIRQDKYADALRHFGQAADRSPATEEIKRNLGRFISEAKLGRIRPRQTALSDAARLYAKLAFSKEVSRSEGVGWQFIPFVSPNGERETLPSLNYEDHVCSACNGRGRMTCRAPGCQHGQIHGDALVNNPINIGSARSPLVVDNINSVPVSHACPTCGGTGYVRCPYCGGATSRNLDTPTPSRKTRRKK